MENFIIITILAIVFIIGLCVGSFLNVVILRSLSEESIAFPASKCPKCQAKLKWWHNVPVISYICLRGKCGFCKEPISIQYPIVELITGIVFTLLFIKYGISFDTVFALVVASLLIVIAGTDVKEKVVFDVHTYSLIGVGLLYAVIVTGTALFNTYQTYGAIEFSKELVLFNPITISLLGIILGIVVMETIARLGYLVAGTRAFGEGDTYIAAGLGAMFGWKALIFILVLSLIIQVLFTLPVFIRKLIQKSDWKTLTALTVFLVYTAGFLIAQGYINMSGWLYTIAAVILAGLGLYACKQILTGLKEKQEDLLYLPFGPAMVIAALIMLIF